MSRILTLLKPRLSTVNDLVNGEFSYLWSTPNLDALKAADSTFSSSTEAKLTLEKLAKHLREVWQEKSDISREMLSISLKTFAETNKLDYNKFMYFLRPVLSGSVKGPPIAEIMTLLGVELVVQRLLYAASIL